MGPRTLVEDVDEEVNPYGKLHAAVCGPAAWSGSAEAVWSEVSVVGSLSAWERAPRTSEANLPDVDAQVSLRAVAEVVLPIERSHSALAWIDYV